MIISTPLDEKVSPRQLIRRSPDESPQALTHDPVANQKVKDDPFCDDVGSIRGMADMMNGGALLDSPAGWDAWPEELPLLLYHGGADAICDPKATVRFAEKVRAKDKKVEIFEVSRADATKAVGHA